MADARKASYDPTVFNKRVPLLKRLLNRDLSETKKELDQCPSPLREEICPQDAMLVSQRKIADGLGEMSRFSEHKKEQS